MGMTGSQAKQVRDDVLQLLGAADKLGDRLIDLSPLLLAQINYFTGIASTAEIIVCDGSYLRDHPEFQQERLKNKTVLSTSAYLLSVPKDTTPEFLFFPE